MQPSYATHGEGSVALVVEAQPFAVTQWLRAAMPSLCGTVASRSPCATHAATAPLQAPPATRPPETGAIALTTSPRSQPTRLDMYPPKLWPAANTRFASTQ